jgi:hypothetical protein
LAHISGSKAHSLISALNVENSIPTDILLFVNKCRSDKKHSTYEVFNSANPQFSCFQKGKGNKVRSKKIKLRDTGHFTGKSKEK